jgi:glycerol-3-phosphate dehydrogenase
LLRDIDQLAARTFDVLVVGGGIYGLTIAYDASQRGLSVALIERSDFGSGSSFNHLRTIHGGLRYLQTLDIGRARESVRERRTLAQIAPHAVRPLPFVLPLFRSLSRGKLAMRAGFMLDAMVANDRNQSVPERLQIPTGHVLSRAEAIERFPALNRPELTGAAVWYDYVTPESDRLTLTWAAAAWAQSAVLANYVDAVALLQDGRRVAGVRARDLHGLHDLAIHARVTVNATGGAIDRLLATSAVSSGLVLLKAMNLVTRREGGESALGGRSASGRNLFLVPWHGRAIAGTWESTEACASADAEPTAHDVFGFVAELNEAFPAMKLGMEDVTLVHRGLVPAVAAGGRVSLEGHERIWDHAAAGLDGIVSVAGAKYTTARAVAERVTNLLVTKLQRKAPACRTASTPLPGGEPGILDGSRLDRAAKLPADTMAHLVAAYGARYNEVLEATATHAESLTRMAADSPVIGAELLWAVRKEMAITLSDVVIRRTPLGALGYPGDTVAERAADIVGGELEWSSDKRRQEIAALRDFYRIYGT